MDKMFEINRTKIKGGCQSTRKEVTNNSKNDLPLVLSITLERSNDEILTFYAHERIMFVELQFHTM